MVYFLLPTELFVYLERFLKKRVFQPVWIYSNPYYTEKLRRVRHRRPWRDDLFCFLLLFYLLLYYKLERAIFKYPNRWYYRPVINMKANRKFIENKGGEGYLTAVILLVAVMMATIIASIVFFAFANGITGTSTEANNTKATIVSYAVTVFAMMAIVPLIMVGGLMLRSLGFMGSGGV